MSLDTRLHGGLVAFDGEEVVGAVVLHQFAGGLRLGVECIQADQAPIQFEPLAEDAAAAISLVLSATTSLPR